MRDEGFLFSVFHNKFTQGQGNEGFTVQVLNDFDVPWVEWKNSKYPMYMRTLNLSKRDNDDADYGQEDEGSDMLEQEDEDVGDDDDEDADEGLAERSQENEGSESDEE